MSDRFEGTALLSSYEGVEYLHILGVRANGDRRPWRQVIPVRPSGTPENSKRHSWQYTVHGDTLEVSPSVKVSEGEPMVEIFHNEGLWRVRFERFTPSAELIWVDGIGDHGERKRFTELNPEDFSV